MISSGLVLNVCVGAMLIIKPDRTRIDASESERKIPTPETGKRFQSLLK